MRVVGYVPFFDAAVINYGSVLYHQRRLLYNYPRDRSFSVNRDVVVVLSGPTSGPSELREPVLENLLKLRQLPFALTASIPLPGGRQALLYGSERVNQHAADNAINLITAKDESGTYLYPVGGRMRWSVSSGSPVVLLAQPANPAVFDYLYRPKNGMLTLEWIRASAPACSGAGAEFVITMRDRDAQKPNIVWLSRKVALSPDAAGGKVGIELPGSRPTIVSLHISALVEQSCLGWTDIRVRAGAGGAQAF